MHKKLADELMSLAHRILQMKRPLELEEMLAKTNLLQEKLSLLALIERYDALPQSTQSKEELMEIYSDYLNRELEELKSVHDLEITPIKPEEIEEELLTKIAQEKEVELEAQSVAEKKESKKTAKPKKEVSAGPDLFSALGIDQEDYQEQEFIVKEEEQESTEEKAPIVETVFETTIEASNDEEVVFELDSSSSESVEDLLTQPDTRQEEQEELPNKTINEMLFQKQLSIGLNDRIAFVKHLFNGDQQDFNRVISQINTLGDVNEAMDLIKNHIRPEYDWSQSEEIEARFFDLIERKFS